MCVPIRNKPILYWTEPTYPRCISSAVYRTLWRAGLHTQAREWNNRVYGQKLNYKRRLKLAFQYVEIR